MESVDNKMLDKVRSILLVGLLVLAGVFITGCSNNDPDPDDYMTSLLTGEYGKDKLWQLTTILNGDTIPTDGYVRFDQKYQADNADIRFVNIIPGESSRQFSKITLDSTEKGLAFTIDYVQKSKDIHISGIVSLGRMTVDMTLKE